jgi:hypothetical protein
MVNSRHPFVAGGLVMFLAFEMRQIVLRPLRDRTDAAD